MKEDGEGARALNSVRKTTFRERAIAEDIQLAICMATHSRLGAASPISVLTDTNLLREVCCSDAHKHTPHASTHRERCTQACMHARTHARTRTQVQLNAERVRTRAACSAMATDMSQLLDGAQAPIFSIGLDGEVRQLFGS